MASHNPGAAACDNPSVLCQDCSRPLFRWFLGRIDWKRILRQMPRRAAGAITPLKGRDG